MDNAAEMRRLAERALHHFKNKTTDQAADLMTMPIEAYTDPVRYQHEIEAIFRRRPLALALSIELPSPKTYRAMNVSGIPVLLVRGEDGVARAFINACRHRGAPVCEEGSGTAQRFVCPYHAWQYNLHGELTAIYGAATFGEISGKTHSLTELACVERSGLVWVCLTPGVSFDIDEWLGGFAEQLDTLQLGGWHIYEQRDLDGPGWKVAWDGYLEAYHHNLVHTGTVGKYTIGNLMLHDTYGPHQRITFGRRTLSELDATPPEQWESEKHIRLIHSVFPNLSISGVLGDHCLVSQVFPGDTADKTVTRQTVLVAKKPETPAELEASATFSATVLQAVRDEDYRIGMTIQAGLKARRNDSFTYGKNEPAVQHFHQWVKRFSNEPVATVSPIRLVR